MGDLTVDRRTFNKACITLAGMLGINPAAALESLEKKTPLQALGELANLQNKVDDGWKNLNGNFFNFIELPGTTRSSSPSDKEHDQRVLDFLETCDDRKKLDEVIAAAYVKRYQTMDAINIIQPEISARQQALLDGDDDIAVRFREASQKLGQEARLRFIQDEQPHTRRPDPSSPIEKKPEETLIQLSQDTTMRRIPITMNRAKVAEHRWEKLEEFKRECPPDATLDEVQECFYRIYSSFALEHFLPILKDVLAKEKGLINRLFPENMLSDSDKTPHPIGACFHNKNFWLARTKKASIEHRISTDNNFDFALYHAVIDAAGDNNRAGIVNTKLTFGGQHKFQLRILEKVVKSNALSPEIKESINSLISLRKRHNLLRMQKLQERESQQTEKTSEQRTKHEDAKRAEALHVGALSEDTKTALDAMRRPDEFGAEHSWFEQLNQDRNNKTNPRNPRK